MNIYEKMNEARSRLLSTEIKKSGKNAFAKYSYHELGDFSNEIQKINKEVGLFSRITIGQDMAEIFIYDTEDMSVQPLDFSIEVGRATLKGAHEIQNRGAEVTYMRRYLYMMAYDITEHDAIDSSKPLAPRKAVPVKDQSEKDFYDDIESYNLPVETISKVVAEFGVDKAYSITPEDRQKFLNRLNHESVNR